MGGEGQSIGDARTFKPRRRRLGPRRAELHDRLLPLFGVAETGSILNPRDLFDEGRRICLEIGSGNGDLASYVARQHPDLAIIAVDVHRPGIARLLDDAHAYGLSNLKVVEGDALVFAERLASSTIDEIWIFFPDPWPKNAQAHRRLVTEHRLNRLARLLRDGGVLRFATDVESYAQASERMITESPLFGDVEMHRPDWRVETVFERMGREVGRRIVDFSAVRSAVSVD